MLPAGGLLKGFSCFLKFFLNYYSYEVFFFKGFFKVFSGDGLN